MNGKLLLERWNIMAGLSEEDEMMPPMMGDEGEEMPSEMEPMTDELPMAWSDWLMSVESGGSLAALVESLSGLCSDAMSGGSCMLEVPSDSDLSVSVYTITEDPSSGSFMVVKDDEEDVETTDSMEAAIAACGLDAARDMGLTGDMLTALEDEFSEMMGSEDEEMPGEEEMADMLEESRLLDLLRRARALNRR